MALAVGKCDCGCGACAGGWSGRVDGMDVWMSGEMLLRSFTSTGVDGWDGETLARLSSSTRGDGFGACVDARAASVDVTCVDVTRVWMDGLRIAEPPPSTCNHPASPLLTESFHTFAPPPPRRVNYKRLDRPTHNLFTQRLLSSGARTVDGDTADWYFISVRCRMADSHLVLQAIEYVRNVRAAGCGRRCLLGNNSEGRVPHPCALPMADSNLEVCALEICIAHVWMSVDGCGAFGRNESLPCGKAMCTDSALLCSHMGSCVQHWQVRKVWMCEWEDMQLE
eukprot:188220-Chlamydomonas_euryale.AAC.5